MEKRYSTLTLAIGLSSLLYFSSCDKADLPNESELITTLQYTLIDSTTKDTSLFLFLDKDGDGGFEPLIRSSNLKNNHIYFGQLSLFNEATIPATDIGIEIKKEAEAHQFFYISEGNLDVKLYYTDQDSLGYPIGLTTRLETGNTGSGTLRIVLRHQPDKTASGVSNGTITNAGGDTDIDVRFPITIL